MTHSGDFDRRLEAFVWASGWTFLIAIGFNCIMFIWYALTVSGCLERCYIFSIFPIDEAAEYFLKVKLMTAIIGLVFLCSYLWRRKYRMLVKKSDEK